MTTQKKRRIVPLMVILVLVFALLIWFWPIRIYHKAPDHVDYIELFDGNSGASVRIEDTETIEKIVDNLQSVYLRRKFLSFGDHSGFNLLVNIYEKDSDQRCHFTINSEKDVKKSFQYTSYYGTYEFSYLENLINQ